MKSTVERLSPTRVRINVEVRFDELKPDFDRAYKKIAQQVRVPGFRPGKVPARIIEARLGRGVVLEEVVNGAVPAKYSEAITAAENVTPIGRPDIEVTEIADNDKLSFKAEVDVRPQIDLPDLASLAVSVDDVEVTDADVQEQLDNLRARFGTLTGVERPAAQDDFVQIDLSATVDGVAVEEAQTSGFSYQVGQGGLIDGIDEAITGLSAGETATFPTTLVAGEFADREAEVSVTVTAVKERELPEADDEFAQLASEFDTIAELKESLVEQVSRVKRIQQAEQIRDKALEVLLEDVEVPLPEAIVKAQVDDALHNAIHGLEHDEDKFNEQLTEQGTSREEFDADNQSNAEKAVKTQLLMDAVADKLDIQVGQEDLTERLVLMSRQYGIEPQQLLQVLQQNNQLPAMFADVRRGLTIAAVVHSATVTDTDGNAIDTAEFFGPAGGPGADAAEAPVEVEADDADESADADADAADDADEAEKKAKKAEKKAKKKAEKKAEAEDADSAE